MMIKKKTQIPSYKIQVEENDNKRWKKMSTHTHTHFKDSIEVN